MYRTHDCNQLRKDHIGQSVMLAGWVNSRRDHGGVIFIDLRDREGLTQLVVRPEEFAGEGAWTRDFRQHHIAHELRSEDVIRIKGYVSARLPGTENPKLATGEIEVIVTTLTADDILSKADVPPFPMDAEIGNEDLRLSHRYLDLRRARMLSNLK